MLQAEHPGGKLIEYGFLISVELEENSKTKPEHLYDKFADCLSFVEGVGTVEVTSLGILEVEAEGA
jgi:hypothetical protein